MKLDLSIENGKIVTETGVFPAHIGIKDGVIVSIVQAEEDPLPSSSRMNAADLHIFPGMVEPHCHFWEPGPSHREDWETGTKAAAAGGVTTVIEMPLSVPPTVDAESFSMKLDIAAHKAHVDYALWGGIVPETGDELGHHLRAMRELGAVAYKVFMCWSAQEFPPISDGLLFDAMRQLARTDELMAVHAENDAIIKWEEAKILAENRHTPQDYLESRPPVAELEAIERALFLARQAGVRLHIVHMSLAEGGAMIKRAKQAGQRVTVETTPQYLALDSSDLLRKGPYAKCAPPLRTRENVENLWSYVFDGTIDFLGSDHAPFTKEEKNRGAEDIWQAANGLPGIQEMFVILLTEGVHKRNLPLERVASLTSGNTARTFRLYPKKGAIQVGSDADLIFVDLDEEWLVTDQNLFYKCGWSPYAGNKMRGKIKRTLVRGQTVYADGEIFVEPGFAEFVKPVSISRAGSV